LSLRTVSDAMVTLRCIKDK